MPSCPPSPARGLGPWSLGGLSSRACQPSPPGARGTPRGGPVTRGSGHSQASQEPSPPSSSEPSLPGAGTCPRWPPGGTAGAQQELWGGFCRTVQTWGREQSQPPALSPLCPRSVSTVPASSPACPLHLGAAAWCHMSFINKSLDLQSVAPWPWTSASCPPVLPVTLLDRH